MKIEIDLKSDKCNYPECRNYNDGICYDMEARKDCLDIALAVLCLNNEEGINEERL